VPARRTRADKAALSSTSVCTLKDSVTINPLGCAPAERDHAQDRPVLGQTKTIAVLEIDRDAKEGGGDIGSTGGVGVLRLR
jgi:hypothetical protein